MNISLHCQIAIKDITKKLNHLKQNKVGNLENTQSQMRKGVLEFCILSIISQGEVYPSDIIVKMKEAKLMVVEGTLYPLLTRLKNGGLLSYSWVESTSGPPRKYYKLTPLGEEFLKELKKTWDELVEQVNQTYQNSQTK